MSYAFPRDVERIDEAVRQIAAEQIDKAIAEIDDADLTAHETVHQVRKRCKKLRALARLVRPGFPSYKKENAFFRDLARGLSGARDAQVMCDAYNRLVDPLDISGKRVAHHILLPPAPEGYAPSDGNGRTMRLVQSRGDPLAAHCPRSVTGKGSFGHDRSGLERHIRAARSPNRARQVGCASVASAAAA